MSTRHPPIPEPHPHVFRGAIIHPRLWLWDSWCCQTLSGHHLFCLALNRTEADGSPIAPADRNAFPFHIRHFLSRDRGLSWKDRGSVLEPSGDAGSFYGKSVWSGGVMPLDSGHILMGFTGLKEKGPDRNFFQSMGIAILDQKTGSISVQESPISCPDRDYEDITSLGYYLGPRPELGGSRGEEGGPIMAWRDPFFFKTAQDQLEMFWSAKVAPRRGAIGHARVVKSGTSYCIEELLPPILLPSDESYTQTEVPKIYLDQERSRWFLLIASTDQIYEGQPAAEVTRRVRLYTAPDRCGPWEPIAPGDSAITRDGLFFGSSVLDTEFSSDTLTIINPVTEQAPTDLQLTIAKVQDLRLVQGQSVYLNSALG